MPSRNKLPKWFTAEVSRANLEGIRSELKKVQMWSDGYNAASGGLNNAVPGTGILGGPNRAIVLINRLLQAYE